MMELSEKREIISECWGGGHGYNIVMMLALVEMLNDNWDALTPESFYGYMSCITNEQIEDAIQNENDIYYYFDLLD